MESIYRMFKVLFTFEYKSREELYHYHWLLENAEIICEEFSSRVARGKNPNYLHALSQEMPRLLTPKGLWRYCNDIQEVLNAEGKAMFLDFTVRGGLQDVTDHWTLTVMKRHFMRLHVCVMPDGLGRIPSLEEELKRVNPMRV